MNMKTISSVFCAFTLLGTAPMAMAGAYGEAEQAEEMPRSAPAVAEAVRVEEFSPFAYLALGGLYGHELFEKDAHQINRTYGWGVNARAGYRFHRNVAAELLYENVIEFDADSGQSGTNIDRNTWILMPNVKVFLMDGFCEPYLSIAGGLMHADADDNVEVADPNGSRGPGVPDFRFGTVEDGYGFAMRFGFGADFYATENIFIAPEVAFIVPVTSHINTFDHATVSLSVGYAFH